MINIKNNKMIKNLLFIFSILLVFIVLRPILNYFNNKEYYLENFEEPKFWIQKDGLFKCKDGSFKAKCSDGYVTQSQGAAIHHGHIESKKLNRYIMENNKKMEKLEKLIYGKGGIKELANILMFNSSFIIPFRTDVIKYLELVSKSDNLPQNQKEFLEKFLKNNLKNIPPHPEYQSPNLDKINIKKPIQISK